MNIRLHVDPPQSNILDDKFKSIRSSVQNQNNLIDKRLKECSEIILNKHSDDHYSK